MEVSLFAAGDGLLLSRREGHPHVEHANACDEYKLATMDDGMSMLSVECESHGTFELPSDETRIQKNESRSSLRVPEAMCHSRQELNNPQ